MNHVNDKLPDYIMKELDRLQQAEVDAHLQDCTTCREEYDSLLRLWAKLGDIPQEEPGDRVRVRFYAMLHAFEEGMKEAETRSTSFTSKVDGLLEHIWPRQPYVQVGIAVVLLVVGLIGGVRIGAPSPEQDEIAHLRSEVQTMGHLLTLSLLNQQSASERLQGVSWTTQIDQPDPQIISALLRALKYDPNVNVRLAAVDALDKFVGQTEVREEIVRTLPKEQSPLVQIALIDLVVQERIQQSAEALEEIAKNPKTDVAVKRRIEEGMKELFL